MESNIASGPTDDYAKNHVNLIRSEWYSHDQDTCEMYNNMLECSLDLLKESYSKNPTIQRDGCYQKAKK